MIHLYGVEQARLAGWPIKNYMVTNKRKNYFPCSPETMISHFLLTRKKFLTSESRKALGIIQGLITDTKEDKSFSVFKEIIGWDYLKLIRFSEYIAEEKKGRWRKGDKRWQLAIAASQFLSEFPQLDLLLKDKSLERSYRNYRDCYLGDGVGTLADMISFLSGGKKFMFHGIQGQQMLGLSRRPNNALYKGIIPSTIVIVIDLGKRIGDMAKMGIVKSFEKEILNNDYVSDHYRI